MCVPSKLIYSRDYGRSAIVLSVIVLEPPRSYTRRTCDALSASSAEYAPATVGSSSTCAMPAHVAPESALDHTVRLQRSQPPFSTP